MRKLCSILIAVWLSISLAGCGGGGALPTAPRPADKAEVQRIQEEARKAAETTPVDPDRPRMGVQGGGPTQGAGGGPTQSVD